MLIIYATELNQETSPIGTETPVGTPVAETLPPAAPEPASLPPSPLASTPAAPPLLSRPARSLQELVEAYDAAPAEEREAIQKQINASPGGPKSLLNELASLYREQTGSQRDSIIEIIYGAPHTSFGTVANLAATAFSTKRSESVKEEALYQIALVLMDPPGGDFEEKMTRRMLGEGAWGGAGVSKEFETLVTAASRLAPYLLYLLNPEHPPPGARPISQEIMDKFQKDDDRVWEQFKLDYWDNRDDRVEKAKDWFLEKLKELKVLGKDMPDAVVMPEYKNDIVPIADQVLPVDLSLATSLGLKDKPGDKPGDNPRDKARELVKTKQRMLSTLSKYLYDGKIVPRIPKVYHTIKEERQKGKEDPRWLPLVGYYLLDNKLSMQDCPGLSDEEIRKANESGRYPPKYLEWIQQHWKTLPDRRKVSTLPDFHEWLRAKLKTAKDSNALVDGKPIKDEDIRGVAMTDSWFNTATGLLKRFGEEVGAAPSLWEDRGAPFWLSYEMFGKGFSEKQLPYVKQFLRRKNISLGTPTGEDEEAQTEVSEDNLGDMDVWRGRNWTGTVEDVVDKPKPIEMAPTTVEEEPELRTSVPERDLKQYDPDAMIAILQEKEKEEAEKNNQPARDIETLIEPVKYLIKPDYPKFSEVVKYITQSLYYSHRYPSRSKEGRTQQVLSAIGKFYSELEWPKKGAGRLNASDQDRAKIEEANDQKSVKAFRDIEVLLDEPLALSQDSTRLDPSDRFSLAMQQVMLDILNFIANPNNQEVLLNKFGQAVATAALDMFRATVFALISRRVTKAG